jgi:hypothetical protein
MQGEEETANGSSVGNLNVARYLGVRIDVPRDRDTW